nr:hypothetical protein [Tanacetum cinerariifolium]
GTHNPAAELAYQISEPILAPFRRIIPNLGGLDISPIFAFLAIQVLQSYVMPELAAYAARAGSMSTVFPEDSVGLVTPQTAHFSEPLALACGRSLAAYDLVYETYGQLNAAKSNAPGASGRHTGHPAMGGHRRRQSGRYAGAAMDHDLPGPCSPLPGHCFGPETVGAEHRLQRSRPTGDSDRSRIPRRLVPGNGRDPQTRPDAGAHGRAHHVSVR